MRGLLAGYLSAVFGRPQNSVPLNIIDHGDADACHLSPTMFRSPVAASVFMAGQTHVNPRSLKLPDGAYRVTGSGERVDPGANRRILTDVAPESFWLDLEASVHGS